MSPFFDPDVEKVMEKNKEGVIDYPGEYWKDVSESAKELVKLMTLSDQSKRITAELCLKHPWLTSCEMLVSEKRAKTSVRQVLEENYLILTRVSLMLRNL